MHKTCSFTSYRSRYLHQIYLVRFLHHHFSHRLRHLHCTDLELIFFSVYARHMRTATLTFKPFSQPVISSARFSARRPSMFLYAQLMLRICTVEALGSDQM